MFVVSVVLAGSATAQSPTIREGGDHIVSNVHHPSVTPYLAGNLKSTGAAVIVIPGGGHRELWMD